ncbi:ComF family protein [Myceligenerans indicum]|uniref:ComF family protein n=1 Tax=Myceligenerans indicum TaxID=2593663 RepID=A0ABS1LHX4_9MICO|nr:phosphoribosyltransferase family protein [Myceligenerans indicum]MBL0885839.1 ComF family protein [Myceligenerans indicum]
MPPSHTFPRPAAAPPRAALRPFVDLSRLLLPVACPCGERDVRWCAACARRFDGPPVRVEHGAGRLDRVDGAPPLPVWALTEYSGPVRDVVVHWKDRGRADLDRLLAGALLEAARHLAPLLRAPVAVVPVPSTRQARRRRGRDPVRELATSVVRGLRDGGTPARRSGVLRRRATRDQVGLGSRARGQNLSSAVRSTRRLDGCACVVVDDVVTSGATLAASEHALEAAGADVLGAIVLAATPPPDTRRGRGPAY